MTIADLIKEILETTKERLKTPISGAFLWSFIIYNWRPIILLLFSDTSIENKIIVINSEYCKPSAIGMPIILALTYTLLIPAMMVLIDEILIPIKKTRTSTIYEHKIFKTEREKLLAIQVLELNNIKSGNRDQEQLLEKITTLEESNNQRALADKATIDSLNNKLNELNDIISDKTVRVDPNITRSLVKKIQADNLVSNLPEEFRQKLFESLSAPGGINKNPLPEAIMNILVSSGLFVKENESNRWLLSDLGFRVFQIISSKI